MNSVTIVHGVRGTAPCGILDHSTRLAHNLEKLGIQTERKCISFQAKHSGNSWRRIRNELVIPDPGGTSGPQIVIIQYTPRMYDRYGFSLRFWKIVSFLAQQNNPIILFAHELWGEVPVLNRRRPFELASKHLFTSAARKADLIITNTQDHRDRIERLKTGREVVFCPVASNMPEIARAETRESGLVVIFGLAGTRIRVLTQFKEKLRQWLEAGKISKILLVGQTKEAAQKEEDWLLPPKLIRARASGSEHEVHQALSRADFGLVHQDQKSFSKSGSLMALLALGIPVLSPRAINLQDNLTIYAADEWWKLGEDERQTNAETLKHWYYRNASQEATAQRVKAAIIKITTLHAAKI